MPRQTALSRARCATANAVEQVLLRHARDLLIEREPLHDVSDVLGEAVSAN